MYDARAVSSTYVGGYGIDSIPIIGLKELESPDLKIEGDAGADEEDDELYWSDYREA